MINLSEPVRKNTLVLTATAWSNIDPSEFADWLETSSVPEEHRPLLEKAMLDTVRWNQPEFAANWVLEHRSQDVLAEDLGSIFSKWSTRDKAAASEWLSDNISDKELQASIMNRAEQQAPLGIGGRIF